MTRSVGRKPPSRREARQEKFEPAYQPQGPYGYVPERKIAPVEARTYNQKQYLNSMRGNICTVAVGPPGTGKTFLVTSVAADLLREKLIDKIFLCRPIVEAGEELGFLKGTLEEKLAPYMIPFMEIFRYRLGPSFAKACLSDGKIEVVPFAYMQGRTMNNCMVILDEAENTTKRQMKNFMSRIGDNCVVVINGDVGQKFIKEDSGLTDMINRLGNSDNVGIVEFTIDDIVRSGFCKEVVLAYL